MYKEEKKHLTNKYDNILVHLTNKISIILTQKLNVCVCVYALMIYMCDECITASRHHRDWQCCPYRGHCLHLNLN